MPRPKGSKNKKNKRVKIICKTCNREFEIYPYRLKDNVGYCSLKCRPQHFRYDENTREKHFNWKNGNYKCPQGYILVLCKNHPHLNHPDGYVFEHRLVMEKHIGRYLKPKEQIHHINLVKTDNRIENLKLFSNNSEHQKLHAILRTKKGVQGFI